MAFDSTDIEYYSRAIIYYYFIYFVIELAWNLNEKGCAKRLICNGIIYSGNFVQIKSDGRDSQDICVHMISNSSLLFRAATLTRSRFTAKKKKKKNAHRNSIELIH